MHIITNIKNKLALCGLFSILATSSLYAQKSTGLTFGKGLYNITASDSSFSVKLGVRFQTLFSGSMNDRAPYNGSSAFLIRRSRLKMDGFVHSTKLKYKLELGLSNRDLAGAVPETRNTPLLLFDAVLKWNFFKNLELWAGQTKLPGNRERVISSGDLQFVDRSALNAKYNIDRDIGIQLRNHHSLNNGVVIREIFAFSQGEGRNITAGNLGGFDFTGRLEILPFGNFKSKGDYTGGDIQREQSPKLSIGSTYDYNDRAVRTGGNLGDFMHNDAGYFESSLSTAFVDLMFKYQGFSLMAEYANKSTRTPIAKHASGTTTGDKLYIGSGINVQAGYIFRCNWEVAGRFTGIKPDVQVASPFEQYTLGLSRYIVGHKLKVQGDLTYKTKDNSPANMLEYRLQVDCHF